MDICCIGAGPRGLLVLNRLLAWHRTAPFSPLSVTLIDPQPIGGRVWRGDQAPYLLMNTVSSQITLFYDQTVRDVGPALPGPSLFAWAHNAASGLRQQHAPAALVTESQHLGANDYASRALYGYYLQWCYTYLRDQAPHNFTIKHLRQSVAAVHRSANGFSVDTAAGQSTYDAVVMALGNSINEPTDEQAALSAYAKAHDLLYLPPNFPAEGDLSPLQATDVVAIRGLGLSAHDFIARLTIGRGGRYVPSDHGQLKYLPSGQEPILLAGSRRGFPYHAKALNQKAPGELTQPLFLTDAQFAAWQQVGQIDGATFMSALRHEVEYIYYTRLIELKHPNIDLPAFQLAFAQAPEAALAKLALPKAQRLDWDELLHPQATKDWPATIHDFLAADIAHAAGGSKTDPLGSALEVFRDMRDAVRQLLERHLLSDDEYLDWFLRQFNSINSFLSIGPPRRRNAELLALIDAGVVTLLPPNMQVQGAHNRFVITTDQADVTYRATALIEARVPSPNALVSTNPLIKQLLHDGLAAPLTLQLSAEKRLQTGALLVDRHTHQLLDAHHRTQGRLYCWGVPTEGIHWLTNASPRPLVDDVALRFANQIARHLLDIEV